MCACNVEGSDVRVDVADTGSGIAKAFLPHVFERFRQADGSSTRTHGGLGLGLSIGRHLVELHGGRMTADSAGEGQGSTFTVYLPIREAEQHVPASRARGAAARGPRTLDLEGAHVLIVDDEARCARTASGDAVQYRRAHQRGGERRRSACGFIRKTALTSSWPMSRCRDRMAIR